MPKPHFRTEISAIKLQALASMQAGRASKLKKVRRSVRRSWTYGGGKKTAAKLAVGVGFGAAFLGASIATSGAAAGVIAALAIGSWVVGQMTDTGFAKLVGRKYTGGRATNEWIEKYTRPDTHEKAKSLDERAHKTVRRAFQHYRTATEKSREASKLIVDTLRPDAGCGEAVNLVMALMSITRHLEKTRIYAHPALFLSEWVLEAYRSYAATWNGNGAGTSVIEKVDARIKELMEGHQDACQSDHCYFDANGRHPGGRIPTAEPRPALWDDTEIDRRANELEEARNRLELATVCAPPATVWNSTRNLYEDAGRKYERRSLGIKMKHSITNAWARKTKSERAAYIINQGIGATLTAGSGGVAGGLKAANINLHAGWEVLIEFGFQVTQNTVSGTVDATTPESEASNPSIDRQKAGAKAGAEAQDYLRKAAIHIWEAQKIVDALRTSENAVDCDSAVERLRQIYKVEHHLVKTQKYLGDAIDFVVELTTKLAAKIDASNDIHRDAFTLIDQIMRRQDHDGCGNVCYGAAIPRTLN